MEAAETWKRALDEYRYPVDLSKFVDASQTHRWFYWDLDIGNRHQTIAFSLAVLCRFCSTGLQIFVGLRQ